MTTIITSGSGLLSYQRAQWLLPRKHFSVRGYYFQRIDLQHLPPSDGAIAYNVRVLCELRMALWQG